MTNTIEIKLHYFLYTEGIHVMDAHVHNECEHAFLAALDEIQEYIGEFDVKVEAKEEGGVIDFLQLAWNDPTVKSTALLFMGAFINNWFSKKRDAPKTTLSTLEIIDKIKGGNYTEEEATIAIGNNKKLQQWKSKYYSSLDKEEHVKSIHALSTDNIKQIASSTISKSDFNEHIIKEQIVEKSQTIESTGIRIISPVLSGQGKVWIGVYSGKSIKFKIEDKDFIRQVHNNEIKFGANTAITCRLKISEKFKNGEADGETDYTVLYVSHWADDDTYQNETKKFKKIKADSRQLDLFNQLDTQ